MVSKNGHTIVDSPSPTRRHANRHLFSFHRIADHPPSAPQTLVTLPAQLSSAFAAVLCALRSHATRHSRATHICPQGGDKKQLPFAVTLWPQFFGWVLLWPRSRQEKRPSATHPPLTRCPRHSPAKRATHSPPAPLAPLTRRPCHSPAARAKARHSPATRTTHSPPAPLTRRRRPAMGWSKDGLPDGLAEKGWQSRVDKGRRGPRRSPGKSDDFLCEFLCGKAFFLTPVGGTPLGAPEGAPEGASRRS